MPKVKAKFIDYANPGRATVSGALMFSPGYISVPIISGANPEITFNTTSYVVAARICTPGSNSTGIPTRLACSANCITVGKYGNIRLYDLTNAQVIAENLLIGYSADFAVQNLGTISNWPTGNAILEIQGRKDPTNGANTRLTTFAICWL